MHDHPGSRPDPSRRGERLTLAYLARRTRQELFDLDRGLLGTAWDLLWRPGQVTSAFIEGRLTRYYSPARYFVIVMAVTVLVGSMGSPLLDGLVAELLRRNYFEDAEAATDWVADWNALLYMPLILLLALAQRYFFRSLRHNFAEHLTIAAYGWSQLMLIGLATLWLIAALAKLGVPKGWLAWALGTSPVWWMYFCAGALRLRSVFDWVRALMVPISSLALFMAVVGAVSHWAAMLRDGNTP